ncbi:MAG: proteasome-activating nucleotidase [Candidatus Diapherotrites archaeon]
MENLPSKINKKNALDLYDYVFTLEEQVRTLEEKNRIFRNETDSLRMRYDKLMAEHNEIKKSPYVLGTIREMLGDSAVVRGWNNNELIIDVPEKLREDLNIGTRIALTQRGMGIMKILPKTKDPRAKAMEIIEKPKISFKNIGGLHNEILDLQEAVILPLTEGERFKKLGIEAPNGILLHGAPGTGKTMLAKALAHESHATFISLIGSELARKYIGEGAELVRDVFALAEEKKPAIIFIDEIDAIASRRIDEGTSGDREVQRTMMQLLNEMDGFKEKTGIKILSATNRIDVLDAAILRPGRFDRIVEIPLPELEARREIFKIHTSKMTLAKDVDLEKFAKLTDEMTGADIKALCTEAGMFALREEADEITNTHFTKALDKVKKLVFEEPHQMFS